MDTDGAKVTSEIEKKVVTGSDLPPRRQQKKRPSSDITGDVTKEEEKPKTTVPIFRAKLDLEKLTQRSLVELVLLHQAHWDPKKAAYVEKLKKRKGGERELDWERYSVRHVAFKVAYLGWDFNGLVTQQETSNTVEAELAEAFKKVKLVRSLETCNWSRAGRTDKGVSALGQVVACHVRSNVSSGVGIVSVGSGVKDDSEELDYVTMLNGSLPDEIRVLGWSPVPLEFDARFSAISRTYKYFFAKEDLDVAKMQEAMNYLIGEHDFRNFCKMDTINVLHFNRCVINARISPVATSPSFHPSIDHPVGRFDDPGSQHWNAMYEFTISGSAFLWHQVRYMVSVLFMVGRGQEKPTIIRDLLNIKAYPQKPVFPMASEIPLILYDVGYSAGIHFQIDVNAQRKLHQTVLEYWSSKAIKASMARLLITHIDNSDVVIVSQGQQGPRHKHDNPPTRHTIVEASLSESAHETYPHKHVAASNTNVAIASSSIDSTSDLSTYVAPMGTYKVPTLIPPHHDRPKGERWSKREVKNVSWRPNGEMPESLPWGFIKEPVLDVFHPRHFHQPLDERAQEESYEERHAKRPYKKPKFGESPDAGTKDEDADE